MPGKDSAGNDACLQKLKSLFKIKGDALTVPLDGGELKTYVSTPAACDGETTDVQKCRAFSMLGYFPQTRSYLIVQALYECGVLFVRQPKDRQRDGYAGSAGIVTECEIPDLD